MSEHALTVRAATSRDAHALSRLAALTSGSVFADPFQNTTDAVPLLRCRRYQLLRQGGDIGDIGDVGAVSSLLRRLAPSA